MPNNWFFQTKIAQANVNNILLTLHTNRITEQTALQQLKILNIDPTIFCEEIINFANQNRSMKVMQLYNNLGCSNQTNVQPEQQPTQQAQDEVSEEI